LLAYRGLEVDERVLPAQVEMNPHLGRAFRYKKQRKTLPKEANNVEVTR